MEWATKKTANHTAQRATVLVVDDETELRAVLSTGLTEHGFEVLQAETVAEAQRLLRGSTDIDIVISDVRMPGGADGTDLAIWLYQFLPKTILILTSGYFPPEESRAGPLVYGYRLPKPFRPSQAASLIEQCLQRRDRERRAAYRPTPWG